MATNTDVCRASIRPPPRPECEYNEYLSTLIPFSLARAIIGANMEAVQHPGIGRDTTAPQLTLQDFMVPAKAINNAATQRLT